jgi:uncharacterized protein
LLRDASGFTRVGRWIRSLGAQIDLLFDRSDGVVSLCEIKFDTEVYTVTNTYARDLQRELDIFQTITRTRKKVQWVLITCNGFKPNTWSEDLIDIALDAAQSFAGNA